MRRNRVAVSGYYGYGNAGDEAVLSGLIRGIRAVGGQDAPEVVIFSGNPAASRRTHNTPAVHRYNPAALVNALYRSDLLLSGGGSLLQDVTSANGIFYYLGIIRLAQIVGRPTMFIAQGIGPLLRPRSRKLVAAVADSTNAITVRDPESADLLLEIGVRQRVQITADPALLLPDGSRTRPGEGGPVVVSLRAWPKFDATLPATIARACAPLAGIPMGTVAMQHSQDDPILARFRDEMNRISGKDVSELAVSLPENDRLPEVVQQIATSRLVIGMRLHALILAAGAGVPSVALAYDPKILSFMRYTGQEDAVVDLRADGDTMAETIARVSADLPARAERLRQRIPVLREAALRNARVALDLLP